MARPLSMGVFLRQIRQLGCPAVGELHLFCRIVPGERDLLEVRRDGFEERADKVVPYLKLSDGSDYPESGKFTFINKGRVLAYRIGLHALTGAVLGFVTGCAGVTLVVQLEALDRRR